MNKPITLPGLPGHLPVKGRVIRPERCEKCKFRGDQVQKPNQFECRESPPVPHSFMVPGPNGSSGFITHTTYPIVQADNWCGKFAPRIEGMN